MLTTHTRTSNGPPTFLTRADVAARWHTSTGRLANMASAGTGPAYVKIGQRCLYALDVLQAYEATHLVQTTGTAA